MLLFVLILVLILRFFSMYEGFSTHGRFSFQQYMQNIQRAHQQQLAAAALAREIAAAKAREKAAAAAKAKAEAEAQRAYKEVSMVLTFPRHKTKVYELIKYNQRRYDKKAYIKKYGVDNFFQSGQFNNQYSNILPFDWKSYLERYPDLAVLPFQKEAAIDHWLTNGYAEGRVGSQNRNEVLCEPGELQCIETRIQPQRSETYNVDFNSPFDRYTTTNVSSDYNQAYYRKDPFQVDLPIVTSTKLNNVSGQIYPYTYCNWEQNQPSCVFTTRGQSQEKHNAQVGDWLQKKQQTEQLRATATQTRVRSIDSNTYTSYSDDTQKYIRSI